ncbi:MAG: serine protease DegQ [Pseudomonadota bacterium]|jgi:serine protease DegQ
MLKKLWLVFAQTVTVVIAVLFAWSTWGPAGGLTGLWPVPVERASVSSVDSRHPPGQQTTEILSYARGAQRAMPAVVNIFSVSLERPRAPSRSSDGATRRPFRERTPERQTTSLGSGVIVSRDGVILTNHHVIEDARALEVMLADGSRAVARILGSDPETDLAVLQIPGRDLPAIEWGDSESVRVGDVVLAIGNPFGVGQTVTQGIVSALGRNQLGINTFENFIQTDAAINPGNSGGALVDSAGRLIGINTAIYSRSGGSLGIGFAIPVSTARQVLDQLIRDGSVTRGYIGVEPVDLTEDLITAFGLPRVRAPLIVAVIRGGPADLAGIRRGDILVAVEERPIGNTATMLDAIARLEPGTEARFRLLRAGREIEIRLKVGRRPVAGR